MLELQNSKRYEDTEKCNGHEEVRKYLLQLLCMKCVRVLFPHDATAPSGPGPPHYRGFTITRRHTTLGRTPLEE
jgi:hypothetical protein